MWRSKQNIHHRQLAGRVPLLPEQCHPDQVLVLGPDGHLSAVAAAAAGRPAVHQRRPVRAVAESSPTPSVVAGRWSCHYSLPRTELRRRRRRSAERTPTQNERGIAGSGLYKFFFFCFFFVRFFLQNDLSNTHFFMVRCETLESLQIFVYFIFQSISRRNRSITEKLWKES